MCGIPGLMQRALSSSEQEIQTVVKYLTVTCKKERMFDEKVMDS
jgi:hypothetical protein